MPKIGLNDDDANTGVAGPIGALVSIRLVPALILPLSISSTRIKGFGTDDSVILRTKRLYNSIPSVELLLAT